MNIAKCQSHPIVLKPKITGSEEQVLRKPRYLCFHGFRTSGDIFRKQIQRWPKSVLQKIDLVFVDAPFPCKGKSEVEGIFDPPYFEWFQINEKLTEYTNFDECLAFIEDCMVKHEPIDGLMGFSQGAVLSAGLAGMQAKGYALKNVPKIKSVVVVGGAKFRVAYVAEKAYSATIECPSLHFLGEKDYLRQYGTELLGSFLNPTVIHHPWGHTIPKLDKKSSKVMLSFIEMIQKDIA